MTGLQFIELILNDTDLERRNRRLREWSKTDLGSSQRRIVLEALSALDEESTELYWSFLEAIGDAMGGPKEDDAFEPRLNSIGNNK